MNQKPKVLFVDDEPNILSSLVRLFRNEDYEIITAEGGEQALALLFNTAVNIVVSDQRMPHMSGSELLAKIKAKYPDTLRIILTGYQDISAAISAINDGGVHYFLQKPWNDEALKVTVRNALEQHQLKRENAQLRLIAEKQNAELKELNFNLEKRILERTKEVEEKAVKIESLYSDLQRNFGETIAIFSNLVDLRNPAAGAHSQRVRQIVDYLADKVGLSVREKAYLKTAALVHDIGKICLPDAILQKTEDELKGNELALFCEHTVKGQNIIEMIDQLKPVGPLVRYHHERWDGHGYPDGLRGAAIPLSARILAAANLYDNLCTQEDKNRAKRYVENNSGIAFDPDIAALLTQYIITQEKMPVEYQEVKLSPEMLQVGMTLSRNLLATSGVLILGRDEILTREHIAKLRNYPFDLEIYVYQRK